MKSCENDILVIKIADSLFWENARIVKCVLMPGEGKAVRNSVGAYDVRIPDCLFKASPSLGGWGTRCHNSRILVFEEIPQGSEGSESSERKELEILFVPRFWKDGCVSSRMFSEA